MPYVVDVAVPRAGLNKLTYLAPETAENWAGRRVSVSLGKQTLTAMVLSGPYELLETPEYQLKLVDHCLDEEPILDPSLLSLLVFGAKYYCTSIGEVIFSALPGSIKQGGRHKPKLGWKRSEKSHEPSLQNAPRQRQLFNYLIPNKVFSPEELDAKLDFPWRPAMKALQEKNLVTRQALDSTPPTGQTIEKQQSTLNPNQFAVFKQCQQAITAEKPMPMLLYGVTGAGKTEIYLHLIKNRLILGHQVLVMVPEIGLTPQLFSRFKGFFPEKRLAALHSGMSNQQRIASWQKARKGEADIVIGTRSAIFTPMPNLGLIIVDEEHDDAFKQNEGFRYHGRDLAIKRAQDLNIPILLGSATPSFASLNNVAQERYQYFELTERAQDSQLPEVSIISTGSHLGTAGISPLALQRIQAVIDAGDQAMVFLNRRGFAPILFCSNCNWQAQCQHCSVNLTYHSSQHQLICHQCGHREPAKNQCPDCHNSALSTQGNGTERIAHFLETHFPNTLICRVDRDSTRKKGALEKILSNISNTPSAILVGTQMLAKGHDFPHLQLVVVLDAGQALMSSNPHALEQFAQLLVQVAGRAGRTKKKGQVLIQTDQPDHPALQQIVTQGYLPFAEQSLADRKAWHLPPFSKQSLIRASATQPEAATNFLQAVSETLRNTGHTQLILGPVPSPIEKRAGRYRAQLLLQYANSQDRFHNMQWFLNNLQHYPAMASLRWSIDIDPVEFA